MTLTIALVAGEDSGDQLGAALISSLRSRFPDCRLVGIGGERMRAGGMECWWDASELAHFGLFEVLRHLARIWKLRKALVARLLELRPDVLIGIDAPDFNLGLERRLRRSGIRTVHYVSPTVWAWRAWRIPGIRRAADLVLCLFPFEPEFLAGHGVNAAYVGHPMADEVEPVSDPRAARSALGIDAGGPVFALLPGSRQSEVDRLTEPMIGAARLLAQEFPGAHFVAALANPRVAASFKSGCEAFPEVRVRAFEGRVRDVIAASDVVLCASGTVTLETMLINRPMVVTYRLAAPTYRFAKAVKLVKAQRISLPNILAGRNLVPELIQHDASAERIAEEAAGWIRDELRRAELAESFAELQARLRCNAGERAAEAVAGLLEAGR